MSEKLYKKLEDEFYRSNHPKYRKYFKEWITHLTTEQVLWWGQHWGLWNGKIVDNEKAKELHLEELSGTLVINLADIPSGMSVEEYLNFIQKKNVVIMGL